VKSSGFFLLGVMTGVVGTLMFERWRRDRDPEDAERLSLRVSEHLKQLESRLESAMAKPARTRA
jgi:hypothetical protein